MLRENKKREADWISLGPRMLKWIRRLALGISDGGVVESDGREGGLKKSTRKLEILKRPHFFSLKRGGATESRFSAASEPLSALVPAARALCTLARSSVVSSTQVLGIYSVEFPPEVQ